MSHKVHLEEHTKLASHIPPLATDRAAGTFTNSDYSTVVDQLTSGQPQYEDSMLLIYVGETSGTPDSFSLVVKLQEGTTSTPATDVTGKTITITAAGVYSIPFSPAKLGRYYRTHSVLTFVNGSTPRLAYSVMECRFGGNDTMAPV